MGNLDSSSQYNGGWCTNRAERVELDQVSKTAWRKDEVKVR